MNKAVEELNDYLLNGTAIGTMLGYDGTGIRPIFPIQGGPESNEMNPEAPFLTYSTRTVTDPNMWWVSVEEVTFMVNSNKLDEVNTVTEEMIDILKRMDDSAQEIQEYLRSQGRNDYSFFYVRLVSTTTPDPATEEGGRYLRPVTFRYSYSRLSGRGVG